jgi:hypothetical protein
MGRMKIKGAMYFSKRVELKGFFMAAILKTASVPKETEAVQAAILP